MKAADALGHCLLVFTFLPTLAALPQWLWREATNAFNREDPIVLMFLPVRGVTVLLNAFYAGVLPGVLSGLATGVLLVAWQQWGDGTPDGMRPRLVGGIAGVLGSLFSVLATFLLAVVRHGSWSLPAVAVAFEVGVGLVCGAIAGPTVFRLLRGERRPTFT